MSYLVKTYIKVCKMSSEYDTCVMWLCESCRSSYTLYKYAIIDNKYNINIPLQLSRLYLVRWILSAYIFTLRSLIIRELNHFDSDTEGVNDSIYLHLLLLLNWWLIYWRGLDFSLLIQCKVIIILVSNNKSTITVIIIWTKR